MSDTTARYRSLGEIENLIRAFNNCTLPRGEWTHQAHLIVALWYLAHHSQPEATNFIRNGIQRYNSAVGIKNTKDSGYHETITLFWVQMVEQYRRAEGENRSIAEMANSIVDRCGDPSLPLQYYSRDRLMSADARMRWLEPDLKPLPADKLSAK